MTNPESTPEQLPPELVADIAAAEAEAEAALTAHPSPPAETPPLSSDEFERRHYERELAALKAIPGPIVTGLSAQTFTPGVLPLADLRERLQMLKESGVEEYRDGPIVLRFSPEILQAQRDMLRPSIDPQTPQW